MNFCDRGKIPILVEADQLLDFSFMNFAHVTRSEVTYCFSNSTDTLSKYKSFANIAICTFGILVMVFNSFNLIFTSFWSFFGFRIILLGRFNGQGLPPADVEHLYRITKGQRRYIFPLENKFQL